MAVNLPIAIHSPASDGSSNSPHTPVTPSNVQLLDQPNNNQIPSQSSAGAKRKPSRRANTAERRATHNAVERQRRENLNGRFLDLAALLPNLSQIRRPSKSAIVNSSIAHVHASRRHRLLASRELKQLKVESDTLRRELNEWRDRAARPRVEEPIRSEGFTMILNGDLEVLTAVIGEDDEEGADGYDGCEDGDEYAGVVTSAPTTADDSEDVRLSQNAAVQLIKNPDAFGHSIPLSAHSNGSSNPNIAHLMSRSALGGPMIAPNAPAVSFENPAMSSFYEPAHVPFSGTHFQQAMVQSDSDKVAAWNAQFYPVLMNGGPQQQPQQQQQPQRSIFTPPAFNDSKAFLTNFQGQQQQLLLAMRQQRGNVGHAYGSPDGDDSSSVGSAGSRRRERSGSLNSGSSYGSPQNRSPLGNYDIASIGTEAQLEYGMPKRFSAGLQTDTGVGGHWNSSMDGMNGLMKQSFTPPINVGGGGNGNGFAMMMM